MAVVLGLPRYVPRTATSPLKDIVQAHLDELERVYDDRFRKTHAFGRPTGRCTLG